MDCRLCAWQGCKTQDLSNTCSNIQKESLYINYCLSVFIHTTFNYVRPSGRDTDDDDDLFTESKDEEDREDNKTLLEDY